MLAVALGLQGTTLIVTAMFKKEWLPDFWYRSIDLLKNTMETKGRGYGDGFNAFRDTVKIPLSKYMYSYALC